jgi:hypothetical protein
MRPHHAHPLGTPSTLRRPGYPRAARSGLRPRGQDTSGVVACPLIAPTEREQRWQLNQLRGLLLTLRSGDLSLDDCLRRLIRLLRAPMIDR